MGVIELIRKEGLRRGLSPRTIKTYAVVVNKFLRTYNKTHFEITKRDIENHLDKLLEKNSPGNTINVHLNALKFLYERILKRKLTTNIKFSKVRKRLPEFLTKEETSRLFEAINNPKHQLMVKLLYGTGMRVSELVSLKIKDFEFDENYGWIREGKGGKDRLFVIAKKLREELLFLVEQNKLKEKDWLFLGQGKSHISTSTIRIILKQATRRAQIKKNVHPHTLGHSFATHLIQNGYAVTEVQPLLGHNSLNTTMVYPHMASPQLLNIKSPLDSL